MLHENFTMQMEARKRGNSWFISTGWQPCLSSRKLFSSSLEVAEVTSFLEPMGSVSDEQSLLYMHIRSKIPHMQGSWRRYRGNWLSVVHLFWSPATHVPPNWLRPGVPEWEGHGCGPSGEAPRAGGEVLGTLCHQQAGVQAGQQEHGGRSLPEEHPATDSWATYTLFTGNRLPAWSWLFPTECIRKHDSQWPQFCGHLDVRGTTGGWRFGETNWCLQLQPSSDKEDLKQTA